MIGGWHAGDASPSALALTACYAATALGCLIVAARQHRRPAIGRSSVRGAGHELVWNLLAAALLMLALERQLALLDLVAALLRDDALARGVYGARRTWQRETVVGLAIGAIAIGGVVVLLVARAGHTAASLAAVVTAIILYQGVKAVSLHAIDHLVYRRVAGFAFGNLVEAALAVAAAAIVVGTLRGLTTRPPRARGGPRPISRR